MGLFGWFFSNIVGLIVGAVIGWNLHVLLG